MHTSKYEHASAAMCEGMCGYVDEVFICFSDKAGYILFSFSFGLLTFRFGKIKEREETVLISRFSAESIVYGAKMKLLVFIFHHFYKRVLVTSCLYL